MGQHTLLILFVSEPHVLSEVPAQHQAGTSRLLTAYQIETH